METVTPKKQVLVATRKRENAIQVLTAKERERSVRKQINPKRTVMLARSD